MYGQVDAYFVVTHDCCNMQDFLQYTNHLGLCTEEVGQAGEGLGNAVQGFTHVTLISAAYNLSRTISHIRA